MAYFWSLLGASNPVTPTQQDLIDAKNRLIAYNAIIAYIFPNPLVLGHTIVTENLSARHSQVVSTFPSVPSNLALPAGVTEADFLAYVDFVYSKGFAIDVKYTGYLFDFQTDPSDGWEKLNTYYVKLIATHGEAFMTMFDIDDLAIVPNY